MNILTKILVSLIFSLLVHYHYSNDQYSVTVTVENASSNDGQMFVALYNSEDTFLNETFKGVKSPIDNNRCTVKFENLPKGTYAVSIFHDENDNGKLDKNFVGIPKEDYGCSNNATGFMGPPKWEDAKFELEDDKAIVISL